MIRLLFIAPLFMAFLKSKLMARNKMKEFTFMKLKVTYSYFNWRNMRTNIYLLKSSPHCVRFVKIWD